MRRLIIWAGLLATSTGSTFAQQFPHVRYDTDPRLDRLRSFLRAIRSPIDHLAGDFLAAADRHHLDWRLLPSISVIESGGGRRYKMNNIFGWDSARRGFVSVRDGIYTVASRLAHSKLYKNKELDAVLATYNPRAGYAGRVKAVMLQVDPSEPLRARVMDEQATLSPEASLQSTDRPEQEP